MVILVRRGKEFYTEKVARAKELRSKGLSIKGIASELGVSYSAVYQWLRGNEPKKSKLEEFADYLTTNGPTPVAKVDRTFPKHNDLYNLAPTRGITIKRLVIERNFRGGENYGVWYFLPGQEKELINRVEKMLENFKIARKKIGEILEKFSVDRR